MWIEWARGQRGRNGYSWTDWCKMVMALLEDKRCDGGGAVTKRILARVVIFNNIRNVKLHRGSVSTQSDVAAVLRSTFQGISKGLESCSYSFERVARYGRNNATSSVSPAISLKSWAPVELAHLTSEIRARIARASRSIAQRRYR